MILWLVAKDNENIKYLFFSIEKLIPFFIKNTIHDYSDIKRNNSRIFFKNTAKNQR